MMFKAVIFPVERYNPFHQLIIVFISAVFYRREKKVKIVLDKI